MKIMSFGMANVTFERGLAQDPLAQSSLSAELNDASA